jgi:hypothetical protein
VGRLRVKLSPRLRARLVLAGGGSCLTGGVWQLFGQGFGLITAGGLAITYGLLLMDVDEEA